MNEYGWNDPPLFSYQSNPPTNTKNTNKPALLNKRPAYPATEHHHMTSTTLSRDQPPPTGTGVPPRDSTQVEATPTSEEAVKCLLQSEISSSLNEFVDYHKECIEERLLKEIKKRLDMLDRQWSNLSQPVHERLSTLVRGKALQDKDYKRAEEIHVGLMVDHVSEVKQWLVGIKKLVDIAKDKDKP